MYSRWVNMAVVLLWLAAMGWLVKTKVLPPLLVGDPPSYQTIIDTQQPEPPVGWRLAMNGRPVGWALTMTTRQPDELIEIGSHVHFDELPLEQLTPGWLRSLLRLVDEPLLRQAMDAKSVLLLDPLGRLTRFESTMGMDAVRELIRLEGEIVGNQAKISVRSGEFLYRSEAYLPAGALMADAFQPQARLPGLRQGQTWTVPVFSPLRPPHSPLEILHAMVEGDELLSWGGKLERVRVVVYKTDPGATLGGRDDVRGKLWVRRDGTVLRQEAAILGMRLTFSRVTEHEAFALKQRADAQNIPRQCEPVHVEDWPLEWPAFPLHPPAETSSLPNDP
jgi:hypothetical protein